MIKFTSLFGVSDGLINTSFGIDRLLGFLPDSEGLPTGISTALNFFVTAMGKFSFLLPVGILLQCVAAVMIFEGSLLLYRATVAVYKFIRGGG